MGNRAQRPHGSGSLYKRNGTGPWVGAWRRHDGQRRSRSTRTTDKAAAQRILAKWVADDALRREGVVDASRDKYIEAERKPLEIHVADYIAHCERAGHDPHHVKQKRSHLERLLNATEAQRLSELTPDALEQHLFALRSVGRSARTMNFARQIAVAFMGWCQRTGRVESNTLAVVPKQDEARDRKRVRRPLTDDELARLLEVAKANGRKAWYMAAVLAGLRRGDLMRLIWGDVNFVDGSITITHGKAKRTDVIPMHPQLADELRQRLDGSPALPNTRVFATTVTNLTVQKDFLRAGLARREPVCDANGEPVMKIRQGQTA